MIVVWRVCVGCGAEFGLTRHQTHGGLLGRRVRCGACRPVHVRRLTAARTRRWRLAECDADPAPVYATAGLAALRRELGGPS